MQPDALFFFVVLIFSIIIHEVSHGYVAEILGDPTARLAGRLTLNPLKHIDLFGTIILPLVLALTPGGLLFGWAKPVPYNPYNLRFGKWSEAVVAGAGVFANFMIAIAFAIMIRIGTMLGLASDVFLELSYVVIFVNLMLGFFNLLPLPFLDGSKVFKAILPLPLFYRYEEFLAQIERYGPIGLILVIVIFIYLLSDPFVQFVSFIANLLVGL